MCQSLSSPPSICLAIVNPSMSVCLCVYLHPCMSLCRNSVRALEEESGILLESPAITLLHEAVLEGNWDEVYIHLANLPLRPNVRRACWFLAMEQKYFECLVTGDEEEAIRCLRGKANPYLHTRSNCYSSFLQLSLSVTPFAISNSVNNNISIRLFSLYPFWRQGCLYVR